MQAQESYPIKKILPSLKDSDSAPSVNELSPKQLKELEIRLSRKQNLIEALSLHDMFQ